LIETSGSSHDVSAALLHAPLIQSAYGRGYGTLYTAAYRPSSGRVDLLWPGQAWSQTLSSFSNGQRDIVYTPA
jgi:hypothetical protein